MGHPVHIVSFPHIPEQFLVDISLLRPMEPKRCGSDGSGSQALLTSLMLDSNI